MNKRYWHHVHTKLRPISPWYFLIIAVMFLVLGVVAARQNNIHALKLRDELYQVDKNNGDIESALRNLREYVYGHMNTNLASGPNAIKPPVQLKYHYERLLSQQQKTTSGNLYNDAQNYCEQHFPSGLSGRNRLPCIQEYITSHGSQPAPVNIPDALYKFDFSPPFWSPDLAGWSLLISAIFFVLFIIRYSMERWLRQTIRNHP